MPRSSDSPTDSFPPLKPVVLQVLLALAEEESHGYGVIRRVRERSQGRIRLATGPFYRHLRKLLDAGLVAESPTRPEDADPRRGAYYRLTRAGREVVAAEGRRLVALVAYSEELGLL